MVQKKRQKNSYKNVTWKTNTCIWTKKWTCAKKTQLLVEEFANGA